MGKEVKTDDRFREKLAWDMKERLIEAEMEGNP